MRVVSPSSEHDVSVILVAPAKCPAMAHMTIWAFELRDTITWGFGETRALRPLAQENSSIAAGMFSESPNPKTLTAFHPITGKALATD